MIHSSVMIDNSIQTWSTFSTIATFPKEQQARVEVLSESARRFPTVSVRVLVPHGMSIDALGISQWRTSERGKRLDVGRITMSIQGKYAIMEHFRRLEESLVRNQKAKG
jgi:hypothetical protein